VWEFRRVRTAAKSPMRLVGLGEKLALHAGVGSFERDSSVAGPEDVPRVSPSSVGRSCPLWRSLDTVSGDALAKQEVVLTVPASFDAAARDLTLKPRTAGAQHHARLKNRSGVLA